MPAKKKAEPKSVKVTATPDFDIDANEEGQVRLWGIDFKASKGKLTADVDPVVAKAMKDAKKCK